MQLYACEFMRTCLVWAERSTPNSFQVPSHRFNSATGERKWITQTIYTDSEPHSRLPNSLMPSAKLRSANLPFLRIWCDAVGDRTPASGTPSERSNHCATQGWWVKVGVSGPKFPYRTILSSTDSERCICSAFNTNKKSLGEFNNTIIFGLGWPWRVKVNIIWHESQYHMKSSTS